MKLTHDEIARRTGLSRSYITMLVNGNRNATEKTAKKLAEASGWSWLFWAHPNAFDRVGNPLSIPDPTPESVPDPAVSPEPSDPRGESNRRTGYGQTVWREI